MALVGGNGLISSVERPEGGNRSCIAKLTAHLCSALPPAPGGAGHTREILPCLARGCDLVDFHTTRRIMAAHGPLHAGGGHHGVADRGGVCYSICSMWCAIEDRHRMFGLRQPLGTWRLLTQAKGAVVDPRVSYDAGLSHRRPSCARRVAPHRHQPCTAAQLE